ncbi:MAG: nucleoside monophosphate kinase [Candidatus Saccharibacteria bacterium]|nr:nucleoside monophosphate kinase [Candidatus Saccharibacteria bacterium]
MIILFGPAGSGKSTQGRTLADLYGWRWLSVGQVLRDSGEFDDIMKEGALVDDATVVRLMDKQIEFAEAEGMEIVLDGYPRDKEQTEIMLKAGSSFFDKVDGAVVLSVPVDELWQRIELRGRADDTREALEKRINIFEQNIGAILDLLRSREIPVYEVDGVGEFDEVTERIRKVFEEIKPNTPEVFHTDQLGSIENDANSREKSYGE